MLANSNAISIEVHSEAKRELIKEQRSVLKSMYGRERTIKYYIQIDRKVTKHKVFYNSWL